MSEHQEKCCELIDPVKYDEKEWSWQDKKFVRGHVVSLFHIPLNFAPVLKHMLTESEKAGAKDDEYLLLSDESSPWGSELYLPVTKEVDGLENVSLSGTLLTKVFEGPYKNAPTWYQEMARWVSSQGKQVKQMYFFYTACPKCSKKFEKNYVVLFAKVD